MKNHTQRLLVTGVVLWLIGIFITTEPGLTTTSLLARGLGTMVMPLFNAHLFVKYLNLKTVKNYPLLSMLVMGVVSLLIINPVLVLLAIIGAIGFNKIRNKREPKSVEK